MMMFFLIIPLVSMDRSIHENRMVGAPMNMTRHSMGMIGFRMDMNEREGNDPQYQPESE
jgi:hypothetical protein